jgi:lipoprotein-anchoring transpeptidase ErfK/SrfK
VGGVRRLFVVVLALTALVGCTQTGSRVALTRGVVHQTTATWAPTTIPVTPPPTAVSAPAQASSGGGGSDGGSDGGGGGSLPGRTSSCGSVDIDTGPTLAATATGGSVSIFRSVGDPQPVRTLRSPNQFGFRQHFLVKARQGDWLGVLLPMRPNGAMGWIRASEVDLTEVPYRIQVQQGGLMITVWRGSEVVLQEPIGLGRAGTATPCGEYFLTELLQPTNGGGAYGPYAFGTSAYSEVLTSFAGGNGQIGLHGTNEPGLLGQRVSHGCIRMSNSGITKLAGMLPLGTPLYITG